MLSTKLNNRLYKAAQSIGVIMVILAGCGTLAYKPIIFYPQNEGILIDAVDEISRQFDYPNSNPIYCPVYLFYINDNIYRIEHFQKDNKIMFFKKFINKKIYFRYQIASHGFRTLWENFYYNKNTRKFIWRPANEDRKIIKEIIYDGKVIYREEYLVLFFISAVILIICLIWCIWAFIKYFKKDDKLKLKDGNEEYFLENCKIAKINNKYLLYYVSRLDNRTIKAVKITEEEFLSAKNGNKTLEDFCSTYNLW